MNYHFVLNLDRSTKARYFHKSVRIKGTIDEKGSLIADTLEKKKDGKYVQVWSKRDQEEERRKIETGR